MRINAHRTMSTTTRLLSLFVLLLACTTHAANLNVTTTRGDRGGPECSLRDALTAANTDAPSGGCPAGTGADTIYLPTGSTITLDGRETQDIGAGDVVGTPVLSTDITIEGQGSVIQRNPTSSTCTATVPGPDSDFRLFIVRPPAVPLGQLGSSNTVTLRGLSLLWGCADDGNGGAILNEGAHLQLDQVSLQYNQARDGAAISSMTDAGLTGSLTVTHSSFLDNRFSSVFAGGIVTDQPTTILDSSFVRNGNDVSPGALGGALALLATDAAIVRTRFDDNNAGSAGGAIYATNGGSISVTECDFNHNLATAGGAIRASLVALEIIDTTFASNQGTPALGIGGVGGALAADDNAVVTIRRSLFNGNSAGSGGGGAIFNAANTTIYNSSFVGNKVIENSATTGGAIATIDTLGGSSPRTDISHSTFVGNGAVSHDGMSFYTSVSGDLKIANSIVSDAIGAAPSGYDHCAGSGSLIAFGGNLSSDASCSGFTLPNTPASLLALADNGGKTQTIALRADSVAIDAATCRNSSGLSITADQRYLSRPQDILNRGDGLADCDLGAFEFSSNPTLSVSKSGSGGGRVTATGIDCGVDCVESYTPSSNIVLTAIPNGESSVASWGGCSSVSSDQLTCTVEDFSFASTVYVVFESTTEPSSADIQVSLTGFPLNADAGNPISGTETCINTGPDEALWVHCDISGAADIDTVCVPDSPAATLASGASIVCSIDTDMPAVGDLELTASTSQALADPEHDNDTDVVTILPTTPPVVIENDMQAGLFGLPINANVGALISGQARCRNNGPDAAEQAVCLITGLPAGVAPTCTPSLPANLAASTMVTCDFSFPMPGSGNTTLTASTSANGHDAIINNNGATQTISLNNPPAMADMEVRFVEGTASARPGDTVHLHVLCGNQGPNIAINATCQFVGPPPGTNIVCLPGDTVASLAANASISCDLDFVMPTSGNDISISVTATSTTADPALGNETAQVLIASSPLPPEVELQAEVRDFPSFAEPGDTISGTLHCVNNGPDAAVSVNCTPLGLPADSIVHCDQNLPVSSLAAGSRIVCAVSFSMPTHDVVLGVRVKGSGVEQILGNERDQFTITGLNLPTALFANGFE